MFSDEEKTKIAEVILSKIKEYKCPMCGSKSFSIMLEYGLQHISIFNKNGIVKNTMGTPYIMIICGHCGFMSKHNMIVLGLMTENEITNIAKADL